MSTEELMKLRYKVIAGYPNSRYDIGDIFIKHEWDNGNFCYVTNPEVVLMGKSANREIEKYPHLFKPLSWWEQRHEKDMPEYIKIKLNNGHVRVYNILGKDFFNKEFMRWKFGGHSLNDFLPSTKEEFQEYESEFNSQH